MCMMPIAEVLANITRLEEQRAQLLVTIEALRATLLPSGQGGEAASTSQAESAEDEDGGDAADAAAGVEKESDEETLEATFARARKGKGKRVADEEPSPLRRSQRRRN
ncbi:hypothetical protein CASFOL_037724 [Castilleja foliolosa]|uniref:Uncharacterized protein n=1 Tax=Castilleja foliolosa TaxID=1961234 RepID=A0ABD3BJK6_9LAMI